MSLPGDYRSMNRSLFSDDEIEQILSSRDIADADLADVSSVVATLRQQGLVQPSASSVEQVALWAASVARANSRSPFGTPAVRRTPLTVFKKFTTTAAASMAAVLALSGVGVAANAAAPGDVLYGVDIAMEKVGIGNGAIQERLAEASVLIDREDFVGVLDLLSESISTAIPAVGQGDLDETVKALDDFKVGLGSPDTISSPSNSDEAHATVSELLEFIRANADEGAGVDGKEFGQGVAEIARGFSKSPPGQSGENPGGPNANRGSENNNAGGNGKNQP